MNNEHRLIALMQYGINITSTDGHRWIEIDYTCCTNEAGQLQEAINKTGLVFIGKVYGSYNDALDRVDNLLEALKLTKLNDLYIDNEKEEVE